MENDLQLREYIFGTFLFFSIIGFYNSCVRVFEVEIVSSKIEVL